MMSRTTVVTLLVTGLLVASCGDDSDGGGGDLGQIRAALDTLPPSEDESAIVTYGDVARVAELQGVDRPDPAEVDSDAAVDFLIVTGARVGEGDPPGPTTLLPEAAAPQYLEQVDEITDEMGWNALAIDRFAELSAPPARTSVMQGSFDAGDLDDALGDAEDGVWIVGDPDQEAYEQDMENATSARRMGETLWSGLDGSRLTVSRSPEDLETARSGDESLGDDSTFSALADALDDSDAHSAMLTRGVGNAGGGREISPEQCEAIEGSALAEAPTGVATGQAADDDDLAIVVALTHEDAGAAEANADAVESILTEGVSLRTNQPWTELVTLEDVEVTDDTTVVATLGATEETSPRLWSDILVNSDGLVAPAC